MINIPEVKGDKNEIQCHLYHSDWSLKKVIIAINKADIMKIRMPVIKRWPNSPYTLERNNECRMHIYSVRKVSDKKKPTETQTKESLKYQGSLGRWRGISATLHGGSLNNCVLAPKIPPKIDKSDIGINKVTPRIIIDKSEKGLLPKKFDKNKRIYEIIGNIYDAETDILSQCLSWNEYPNVEEINPDINEHNI